MNNKIHIIAGATASGKSAYAIELAKRIGGVIINADSAQIYKELPILTASPTIYEQKEVPHMLYSIISYASESILTRFSVADWLALAVKQINDTFAIGKVPIVVGGTGLYIKALMEGLTFIPPISQEVRDKVHQIAKDKGIAELYAILKECDPIAYQKLHINDTQRITRAIEVYWQTSRSITDWQTHKAKPNSWGKEFELTYIEIPRKELYSRCDQRFLQMLEKGVLEEVQNFINIITRSQPSTNLYPSDKSIFYPKVLGLRELILYLSSEIPLDEAIAKAQQYTRNYAKRQLTWFRQTSIDTGAHKENAN